MSQMNEFRLQIRVRMQHSAIIEAYVKGNSINETAVMFSLSTRKIREVLSGNSIAIRNHKDASYLKNNKTGDPFDILTEMTPEEEHLKAMALGLYLTEGNLKNKNSVRFSNSNPALVKIFVKFLKVICGVDGSKIKTSLIIYPDIAKKQAKEYWANFLDLPLSRVTKTTVLKNRKHPSPKKHSEFGTITIYVHNTKLLGIIKEWVKEYAHVAQLVEHIHGKDGVAGSTPAVGSRIRR